MLWPCTGLLTFVFPCDQLACEAYSCCVHRQEVGSGASAVAQFREEKERAAAATADAAEAQSADAANKGKNKEGNARWAVYVVTQTCPPF